MHLEVRAVSLGETFEERVGENRDVRAFHPGLCVDVDDFVGGYGFGDELGDGGIEFVIPAFAAFARLAFLVELDEIGAHVGEEPHVVSDRHGGVVRACECERLQQCEGLVEVALFEFRILEEEVGDGVDLGKPVRPREFRVGVPGVAVEDAADDVMFLEHHADDLVDGYAGLVAV